MAVRGKEGRLYEAPRGQEASRAAREAAIVQYRTEGTMRNVAIRAGARRGRVRGRRDRAREGNLM